MPVFSYRFGTDKCRQRCPRGSQCKLSNKHNHELCICGDEHCWCHSEDRYYSDKIKRERQDELPELIGHDQR